MPDEHEPVITYRFSNPEGTKTFWFMDGELMGETTVPLFSTPEPYVHDEARGLDAARNFVASRLPAQIRLSMSSYVIKLVATGTVAEHMDDMGKFAALDLWEAACLDAGKAGTAFPEPPAWFAEFCNEF